MLWTDNLMIPKGAVHKGTAELLINYYYDPEVNAQLTLGVDYISPVKGTDELVIKANPDDANNPMIIPPPDWVARLHIFGELSEADEIYFNAAVRQGDRRRLTPEPRIPARGPRWASG